MNFNPTTKIDFESSVPRDDSRVTILQLLREYQPVDDVDSETRDRFEDFVRRFESCSKRELEIGHLTASAWLLDTSRTKVLFTHHKKLNAWLQLGGHADGDLNMLNVALKEAREESGIEDIEVVSPHIFDLDIHVIPARGEISQHLHYDVRFVLAAMSDAFVVGEESQDLAWFDIRALSPQNFDRSILRMREKWIAAVRS